MSPPAEGFGSLGNRVPSAGTGMGTWPLLVRARKQGPPDFTWPRAVFADRLKLEAGQAQALP